MTMKNNNFERKNMLKKEYEKKLIINREKYDTWLADFTDRFPHEDIFQINYYYDTVDFALFHSNETLRARQTGDILKLQHKYNKSRVDNMRISDEYAEQLDILPKSIIVNGIEAHNVGFMATERHNFNLGNCVVSLDKNYYLGKIDYEIEAEAENDFDLPELLADIDFQPDAVGKYSRYIKKLLELGLKHELPYKNL